MGNEPPRVDKMGDLPPSAVPGFTARSWKISWGQLSGGSLFFWPPRPHQCHSLSTAQVVRCSQRFGSLAPWSSKHDRQSPKHDWKGKEGGHFLTSSLKTSPSRTGHPALCLLQPGRDGKTIIFSNKTITFSIKHTHTHTHIPGEHPTCHTFIHTRTTHNNL